MEEPIQIFISYAHEDQRWVDDLYRKLSQEGFKPWTAEADILGGQDWEYEIKRAIQESDFFLACLSQRSIRQGYFNRELKFALDIWRGMPESNIYLIPVRLEPCEVPAILSPFQWVDLFDENGWRHLLQALHRGLKRRREISPESVLQADSLKEIANVTDKLQGVIDIPREQRAEWRTAVHRFDQASLHIGQYLTLHSEYRKGEALNKAIEEMLALKHALAGATGWLAPRLLRIADKWLTILEGERERFQVRAEVTPETPNPFIFGTPVAETEYSLFSGWQDVVRQIEGSILGARQSPTLLLHGARRMGKTSILNQLARLLGHHFVPAIIDCQNPSVRSSAETMLHSLARKISEGLQRRSVIVEPLNKTGLESEPFTAFDEWVDELERRMPADMRILLCLDEYERLTDTVAKGWGSAVLDLLRYTIQHRREVVLMFTGAHTFAELGPTWTDRFINARRIRVSFLKREEALPLLTNPIPEFDMTYELEALEVIIKVTNGQPFLLQSVAFELVQFLNEQGREEGDGLGRRRGH